MRFVQFLLQLCFSEENTPLDLDDHGGRTFLRVLLHLTMHDYPPLVSGALHLLFRHFSQRQEVLMAFKQVGLTMRHFNSMCHHAHMGKHIQNQILKCLSVGQTCGTGSVRRCERAARSTVSKRLSYCQISCSFT